MTYTAYNSKAAAFKIDLFELLRVYSAEGLAAADRRCRDIIAERGLAPHEALTLADAFRRDLVLR